MCQGERHLVNFSLLELGERSGMRAWREKTPFFSIIISGYLIRLIRWDEDSGFFTCVACQERNIIQLSRSLHPHP